MSYRWTFGRLPVSWLVGGFLAWASGGPLLAHEGPEHEIEELSELIEARGDSAGLLIERAIEYAVLGRNAEAIQDLKHAIQLDPDSIHAHRELGRLQFVDGRADEAVVTVTRALRLRIEEPVDRGGLLVLRAEVLKSQGKLRSALSDCEAALRLHRGNPEWYLLRSDLQRRLKMTRKRIAGIEEGFRETGAGILTIERVDALLDAGKHRSALKAIEPELESVRLRAGWLVRRGRARLGLGDKVGGEDDLRTALKEIDARLDRVRPDPSLLLDQATAWMLLGDRAAANRAYELARDQGGDPDTAERIRRLIAP